jgi:PAS domain S-box-containing protein
MRLLQNLPIRRKLTFIAMLISGVALLLACLSFAVFEQMHFRRKLVRDLVMMTEMTGANCAAGLTFNDAGSVEQTLKSLRADSHIVGAWIYDRDGQPFAKYQRAGSKGEFMPPPVQEDGHRFSERRLDLFQKIHLAGETIGTVYVSHDLQEARESVWRYTLIVIVLLIGCSLVALAMAARLQRVISEPIVGLAKIAGAVATEKNYSVRAVKQSEDEVGWLIDGFNEMLTQIQQRDSALQAAHDSLERRVEERTGELAQSLSLLNATLDSTADGILAVNVSGKVVCHNAKFAAMWGIPSEVLDLADSREKLTFIASQVRNSEHSVQRIAELQARPEAETFDVIGLKDGRTFERYVKPQRIDGKAVGVVISFRDITERKQAEAELENVHKQLLDASRQAGMAEVATGVLHNVGNVLNSVNVSATLLADNLRKSKASNLAKVTALLQEHHAHLGAFMTTDPKGKQLPVYLGRLSEHLAAEQAALLSEIDLLRTNIEHIKDIVTMQQSYAQVSGVIETVKVADLMEDALRMNAGALTRHGVQLIRDYAPVPAISIEKHKVLQILVNLIRNAKYACDESPQSDKRLTLRVTNGDDRVRIAVIDNGVGIPAENLTRIFAHGFTTRKDGHGFGLHSGALAATELGGALLAHSDGPGKGATFTLELPVECSKPDHKRRLAS